MNGLLPYWPMKVINRKFRTAAALSVFVASAILMLS
jgi:hypothetical protein